ncbi:MAG: RIP metalloprotease RseP [Candidatus Marinimicrobia bacterium]|nr:RIP metalloprotease RseP [Candidatus Neomarinimicrobiota bacterium]
MITILAVLLVIGGVIFVHEFGHFIFAKMTGMRVEVFSLGFPPRLIGKKVGDTDYCISAIPIGGYVKVTGVVDESMDVEGAKSAEPWAYGSKKMWQKLLFIVGGVLFNMLLAFIIFSILTASSGVFDPSPEAIVENIIPDLPADSIGIQSGDKILSINETKVTAWKDMTDLIYAHPNSIIRIEWERNGVVYQKTLKTISNKVLKGSRFIDVGMIGISPKFTHRKASVWEAISSGANNTWYWLKITVVSLKMVATGEESIRNLGGPIFIAKLAGQSAKSGLGSLFGLMAIISVNLALINILPIPALDGGHLIVILIEAIIRKPLSINAKLRIQQVGLVLILMLTAIVFYNDIARLF